MAKDSEMARSEGMAAMLSSRERGLKRGKIPLSATRRTKKCAQEKAGSPALGRQAAFGMTCGWDVLQHG
jgi:hypothetical protein